MSWQWCQRAVRYSDLTGVPDLEGYVTEGELSRRLEVDHYKKAGVEGEIERRIGVFKGDGVARRVCESVDGV